MGVSDWGLDLDALNKQSHKLLKPLKSNYSDPANISILKIRDPQIPALSPLLSNSSFARLLEAHLGGPVRYDGSVLLHLGPAVTVSNYISATWQCVRWHRTHDIAAYVSSSSHALISLSPSRLSHALGSRSITSQPRSLRTARQSLCFPPRRAPQRAADARRRGHAPHLLLSHR